MRKSHLAPLDADIAVMAAGLSLEFSLAATIKGSWMESNAQHDRHNLLLFLSDPHVEPTNNRTERALRPAQYSKTESGARTFEAFLSVIQTFQQRSPANLSQSLLNLFTAPGPAPLHLL